MHFLSKIIQLLFLLLLWKISAYGSAKNQSITGIFQELYFSDYLYLKITQKKWSNFGILLQHSIVTWHWSNIFIKELNRFQKIKEVLGLKVSN